MGQKHPADRHVVTKQGQTDDQPMYAHIVNEGQTFTTIELVLFGRKIRETFLDTDHKESAAQAVNEWNEHFDREWLSVRETTATIMQNFINALDQYGVDSGIVALAMKEIQKDAKN